MGKNITVAHIQYDFEAVLEGEEPDNDREFYINIDRNLNEIKEHKMVILANGRGIDAGEGNKFKKLSSHLYRAQLDGQNFLFNTIKRDCSKTLKGADYTSVDTIKVHMRRFILGTTKGDIKVLDSNFNLETEIHQAHAGEISTIKFFPSGEALISGSQDMRLKIWSVKDGSNPRTLIGHRAKITDIAIIDRGRNVLSASLDGSIRLWECGTATTIHTFNRKENPSDGVNSIVTFMDTHKLSLEIPTFKSTNLEFGTCGKHVIAGHVSGVITVHDVFSKEQTIQLPSKFTSACNSLAIDVNEANYVYAGYENGMLAQWDLTSPECPVDEFFVNEGIPINSLYCVSDTLFVSSGPDTSLKLDIIRDPGTQRPKIASKTPTFFVSNDNGVSQFCLIGRNGSKKDVIEVGKYNFCVLYNLAEP